jgi:type IV pilus assembly protein PilM
MALLKRGKNTVGLDIGSSSIKMARIVHGAHGYVLDRYDVEPLPAGAIVSGEIRERDLVAASLKEVIKRNKLKSANVVVSLSGFAVLHDTLTMQVMSEEEARAEVYSEVEKISPFSISEVTLDYKVMEVSEEENMMRVLLVAAKNEVLEGRLELLHSLGVRPAVVDVDIFALYNTFEANYDMADFKGAALMNLGANTTSVTFVYDGQFHSARDLSISTNHFSERLQKELNLPEDVAQGLLHGTPPAELDINRAADIIAEVGAELSDSVEMAISYFRSTVDLDNLDVIMLCGGGALIPGLNSLLQTKNNVPTEVANPLRKIEFDPRLFEEGEVERIAPSLMVAVGLALREVG